ncbi:MAG TPA: D-glycero-beta-D-manno-heptose-7-phosphate kinase [Armatimonadota bacterium]
MKSILDSMTGRRVLVVGDVMVDEYVWGNVRRISPEAPVMVVEVERDSWTAGGAANVVNNIQALGARASIIGVIGDDTAGLALKTKLGDAGVDVRGVVVDASRPTTRKTRIIAHSQQVVRVDRESRKRLTAAAAQRVVEQIEEQVKSADIVVFSDYNKGMAIPAITESLINIATENGKRVVVNPKPRNVKQFRAAFAISLNQSEAEAATGVLINSEKDVRRAAKHLVSARYGGPEVLVVTRGAEGMSLFTKEGQEVVVPAHPVEVYDVAGAGDTVVSVLALSLAAGAEIDEAAILANCAGGAAVRKVGVATVTREEIAGMMRDSIA